MNNITFQSVLAQADSCISSHRASCNYESSCTWGLVSCNINVSANELYSLAELIFNSNEQEKYSEPMPWIGMYIAIASLFCILAMVADLLHGFRNRKLWFPCKYFTLNAASLTVIAVAMKLPVDLSNSMPGSVDQSAKLGSMAFMCSMMANLLPSLATMNSKELLTNIIALDVLVITLVVNVCIEIKTGVIPSYNFSLSVAVGYGSVTQSIYVAMLLMLLIIYICSALAILKSKHILESKYQAAHEIASKDQQLQQTGRLKLDKLKQFVSNYWIMAGTGSPQFMTVCSATTSASGVICALGTILHTVYAIFRIEVLKYYGSDYKWSIPVILITQTIGAILGTIAPVCRCFATLSFKLSIKWIWNHINIFKVERYWTQKLCEWKQSSIPFSISNRQLKITIQKFRILILSLFIGFQKTVVITCKMIGLIPMFFVICVLYCIRCWKWIKAMFISQAIVLGRLPEQLESNQDSRLYVLQLQADTEVAERTLKGITKSMNRLVQKAENQQPHKLIKLLEESSSRDFAGVGKYDSYLDPPLTDCWSLSLVTLTTISMSLSNIETNRLDMLLSSVSEGLEYVTLVEEILNATDEYVKIQKAAKQLWLEVEVSHKWLGNHLKSITPQVTTTRQTLEWLRDTSEKIVTEVEGIGVEGSNEDLAFKSICAKSMNRITHTILLSYQDNMDEVTQDDLSSMIADILAACLTNLPQVIAKKCHTDVIEKREASVFAAAKLLGKATQIINILQDRKIPSLNSDELPFIDKWRAYLQHSIP